MSVDPTLDVNRASRIAAFWHLTPRDVAATAVLIQGQVLLGGASHLSVFDPAQLQALTLLFAKFQENVVLVASVFWGLWLLLRGARVRITDASTRL